MATRLYSMVPGGTLEQVIEAVGAATSATAIEVTVDLSASIVSDQGATRSVTKNEVLLALGIAAQYITRSNWTPA